ncbi:MAG: hypothetical protein IPK80_36235 [Nannocystis sp.]|nr:hypothetical protein [Nannocystis sp.]
MCFGAWFDQGEIDALRDGAVDAAAGAGGRERGAWGGCASLSSGTWPDVRAALPGVDLDAARSLPRVRGLWLDRESGGGWRRRRRRRARDA